MAEISGELFSKLRFDQSQTQMYEWNVSIPRRTSMTNSFAYFPELGNQYEFKNLQFTTGCLGQIKHSLSVNLRGDYKIGVELNFEKTPKWEIFVDGFVVDLLHGPLLRGSVPLRCTRQDSSTYNYVINIPETLWDNRVDKIRLRINIVCISAGICTNVLSTTPWPIPSEALKTSKLFLSESFSDVKIVTSDGGSFPAHRSILSAASSVFERMFQIEMQETIQGQVSILDMEPDVVKELFHNIYCQDFSSEQLPLNMLMDLLGAAEKYDLMALKVRCAQSISKLVTFDNALKIYLFADEYNEPLLKQSAMGALKVDNFEPRRRKIELPAPKKSPNYMQIGMSIFNG